MKLILASLLAFVATFAMADPALPGDYIFTVKTDTGNTELHITPQSGYGLSWDSSGNPVAVQLNLSTLPGAVNLAINATGVLPNASFPATLPSMSGINLTNLRGNMIQWGQIDPARMGTGTRDGTRMLRDDGQWVAGGAFNPSSVGIIGGYVTGLTNLGVVVPDNTAIAGISLGNTTTTTPHSFTFSTTWNNASLVGTALDVDIHDANCANDSFMQRWRGTSNVIYAAIKGSPFYGGRLYLANPFNNATLYPSGTDQNGAVLFSTQSATTLNDGGFAAGINTNTGVIISPGGVTLGKSGVITWSNSYAGAGAGSPALQISAMSANYMQISSGSSRCSLFINGGASNCDTIISHDGTTARITNGVSGEAVAFDSPVVVGPTSYTLPSAVNLRFGVNATTGFVADATNLGLRNNGIHALNLSSPTTFWGTEVRTGSSGYFAWSSAANNLSARDTAIGREQAGMVSVMAGTSGNYGVIRSRGVSFPQISEITATYTARSDEFIVLANATTAAFTVTLPSYVGGTAVDGQIIVIKKTDSSTHVVSVLSGDLGSGGGIDGLTAAVTLTAANKFVMMIHHGGQWFVISKN
jgi:hypothetical protein